MKKITLFNYVLITFLLLGFIPNTNAQLQNANWYFGEQAGIDFTNGVALTDSGMTTTAGCASVSDELGNLLFYTNGVTVWNSNHMQMSNGNLIGDASVSQSAVIIPKPGNEYQYYIFSNGASNQANPGLRYSVVDMTLDSGLGDVDSGTKDIELLTNCSEKLTAIINPIENSYWLVAFGPTSGALPDLSVHNTFYSFKIDEAGGVNMPLESNFTPPDPVDINNPVHLAKAAISLPFQRTLFSYAPLAGGQMKISSDNTSLALVHNVDDRGDTAEAVYTFAFDATTGLLDTNSIAAHWVQGVFVDSDLTYFYGLEFSPDSQQLFVSTIQKGGNGFGEIIKIRNFAQGQTPTFERMNAPVDRDGVFSLQLGNDGNIYASRGDFSHLEVISDPNGQGNFNQGFDLASKISGQGLPQLVPDKFLIFSSKIFNTSYANDTITKIKATDSGVVVFGEIGPDNSENLPGLTPGFIANFSKGGSLIDSDTQQIPYQIPLNLQENAFKWEALPVSTNLNGETNNNYVLSKYNNDNQLEFEITTVNIQEELIEELSSGLTLLLFPTSTYEDFSITGATGRTWTKSATQKFALDSTVFTKTLNLARFDATGVLINVVEMLNYKWARNGTGGTVVVDFPAKISGNANMIYFTTSARDENNYTEAAKIYSTDGEFHKKGEWLMSYDVLNNSFDQTKLLSQVGAIVPNELVFNQSTLFVKRNNEIIKLDQNLTEIDSLTFNKLEILESNEIDGSMIIRAENKRTIKKIDIDFNEIWSKSLGNKFEITHASEALNGDVYISGSYVEDATLKNPDNIALTNNVGTDVFIAKVDGLPISEEIPMVMAKTTQSQKLNMPKEIISLENELILFPNPFSENITIKSNKDAKYSVEIYNQAGMFVSKHENKSNQDLSINTSKLASGIYHVNIIDSNSKKTYKKIIKI